MSLGGGLPGFIPKPIYTTNRRSVDFEQVRFTLRQAWNTTYPSQLKQADRQLAATPFRAVMNAGDLLSRKNYTCGGASQAPQYVPRQHGTKHRVGAIRNNCDGTGIPPASCNPKYVYDSSTYTRFKKQQATAKNYNDKSYGGNQNSGAQVAYKGVRRSLNMLR